MPMRSMVRFICGKPRADRFYFRRLVCVWHQPGKRLVIVFFDSANTVYRIRLNPPFASTVCGTHLGDQRQTIVDRLGPPTQTIPNESFPERTSDVYRCDSSTSVRYEFTSDDRVSSVVVLAGASAPPNLRTSKPCPLRSISRKSRKVVNVSPPDFRQLDSSLRCMISDAYRWRP
jgi:hypothetical protein